MKKMIGITRWFCGIFLLSISITIGVISMINATLASTDEENKSGKYSVPEGVITQESHQLYMYECGSCHMAYPVGLLPKHSWSNIMSTLDSHFGENAKLFTDDKNIIASYLEKNAAHPNHKMVRGIKGKSVIRITELPYFLYEHEDISEEMIAENPDIISISHCNACHAKAEFGFFDEDSVYIPHYRIY